MASRGFIEQLERRQLLSIDAPTDQAAPDAGGAPTVEEMWVPYTPTEAQTEITITRNTEGRVTARVRIVFSDAGYRVTDWGTPRREGNRFIVDTKIERWTGPSAQVITPVVHEYDLGTLPAGQYAFDFQAWTTPVESRVFTVGDDTQERWIPYTPTAEQTTIDILQREGRTIARVKIVFPDSGFRVDWGTVTREGNTFRANAAVDRWTGPALTVITPMVHEYVLGQLDPGIYTFEFAARGTLVESRTFALDGPIWVPYQPTAEQTEIEVYQREGRWKARVTLTFTDNGFRVSDWGDLRREGNTFIADAKVERTGGPLPVVTYASHEYDLGALVSGEYGFNFNAWGKLVERKPFVVPGEPNDWVPYTPTAQQTEISIVEEAGRRFARVTIVFQDSGFRVDWGTLTRDGNKFIADAVVDRYTKGALQVITPMSHTYALGELPPGEYTFEFRARGTSVESRSFVVSSTPDRLVLEGVEADDVFRFFTDSSGENILLFWNNDPSMRPGPLVIPRDAYGRFHVKTLAGDDTVQIDLVQHTPLPRNGMLYDGGAGANDVLEIKNALSTDRIEIMGDVVKINGIPIELVGVEKVVVDRSNGSDVTVGGDDAVDLDAGQHIGTLALSDDALVRLTGDAEQLNLSGLSIADDALLDVRDKTVLITVDASQAQALLAELHALVAAGREANWTGTRGITSSLAAGDTAGLYGVAVSVIPSPLLSASAAAANVEVIAVRYTLKGDLNLDGIVDADDYFRIDSGFLGGARTYSEGDANYDGRVDADDYFIVDSTFLKQGETAAPAPANAPASATVTRTATFSRERISVAEAATRKRRRIARRG